MTRVSGYRGMLSGGLAIVLAGCASYVPKPVNLAANAEALDARRLDDPRLLDFIAAMSPDLADAARAGHWTVAALTLVALYDHPDLALAKDRVAEAAAGEITAGQWVNPTLVLTPTHHTAPYDPPVPVGGAIDILLASFGRRAAREREAAALTEAARAGLATATWQLRDQVQSAVLACTAAEAEEQVVEHRRRLQTELVGLLEHRQAEGALSGVEVSRERAALARIAQDEEEAEAHSLDARAALAGALGVPVAALAAATLDVGDPASPGELPGTADLRRAALLGRSDIRAALAEYAAAEAGLRLEVARQYPDLSFNPGFDYDQGDNKYALSLSAELPILNQNQGPIAEAEARRQAAGTRLLALQARILGAIDLAFARYAASGRDLAAAQTVYADEEQRRHRVEALFAAGSADRPSLVAAELALAEADGTRRTAVAARHRAMAALEDAVQQPLFDPAATRFMPALDEARS